MTKHDAIVLGLERRGYSHVASYSTSKYTVFPTNTGFLFVGKMGALRKGRTVTGSIPVSDFIVRHLEEEGRAPETPVEALRAIPTLTW